MKLFRKKEKEEYPTEKKSVKKKICKYCQREFELGRYEYELGKFTRMMGNPFWEEFGYCKMACWANHIEKDLEKLKRGKK